MYFVNLIAVCAKVLFGLHFAVHTFHCRNSCSGHPALVIIKKNQQKNKTINITCEVCRPSAVWFHYLPSECFSALCCVLIVPLCTFGGCVKCRSTNTQVELSDDRIWPQAKLWELPRTVLTDYLCVSHLHTHSYTHTHMLRQRNYCPSDTLNTLSERMALFEQGGKVKNRECRKGEERRKAHKNMSDPLRQIWHCVIQSCAPHPIWSLLNTRTHSPAHRKHYLKPA